MKTYYLVIALFSVAAADLEVNEENKEHCLCEETSKLSLTIYKEGQGECGLLSLNGCNVTITCQSNSSLTLDIDKSVDLLCSNNTTSELLISDKRGTEIISQTKMKEIRHLKKTAASAQFSINIILLCSEETAAYLDEETNIPVLRISQVCTNNSNGTSVTTTSSAPSDTTEIRTTKNNNNDTTAIPVTSSSDNSSTEAPSNSSTVTSSSDNSSTEAPSNSSTVTSSNNSTVTSDHSSYSNATGTSNSSYTTTEGTPSGNSTQKLTTTTQHAVSFRICSGLLVLMLAVSSLL